METQIFHQVKAEYAFHYDKRCRLEGKNKAKHNLCLGPNHFLCDYLKVLYKLIILTLWFPATLLLPAVGLQKETFTKVCCQMQIL